MRKKLSLLLLTLMVALSASAQFEQGKKYISASFSGLDMGYNGSSEFNVGLQAKGGYFLADNLAVVGLIGYNHVGGDDETPDRVSLGVQGRLGYAFFINRHVTIEPALYYEQSFKDHSKYSNVGLRLGLGIYLF